MWLQAFAIGSRVRHTKRGILNSEGNFPIHNLFYPEENPYFV